MSDIPTWHERAMAHPVHQSGMISEEMIRARMCEEIADLRAEVDRLRAKNERLHKAHQAACKGGDLLCAEIKRLTRERDEARAEARKLRAALQEATLAAHGCAQCRDEIGRICRGALEGKP